MLTQGGGILDKRLKKKKKKGKNLNKDIKGLKIQGDYSAELAPFRKK